MERAAAAGCGREDARRPTQEELLSINQGRVFEELFDPEVAVSLPKLREAARLGVHPKYRGMVYRYLLGVSFIDKSSEMSLERTQDQDFELLRRPLAHAQAWVPSEDRRKGGAKDGPARMSSFLGYVVRLLDSSRGGALLGGVEGSTALSLAAWEQAITAMRQHELFRCNAERRQWVDDVLESLRVLFSHASPEEIFILMQLVLPFAAIQSSARDAFYCVGNIFSILAHHGNPLQDDQCLQRHCGSFLMLFRAVNTVLYTHFFTQGITALEWVPRLLCTLLAGRLHSDDLLRLWDYYFADVGDSLAFHLHPFVCLALLSDMTQDLIECERTEILHRLEHLQRINAATVLQRAISIREDVYARGLLAS